MYIFKLNKLNNNNDDYIRTITYCNRAPLTAAHCPVDLKTENPQLHISESNSWKQRKR